MPGYYGFLAAHRRASREDRNSISADRALYRMNWLLTRCHSAALSNAVVSGGKRLLITVLPEFAIVELVLRGLGMTSSSISHEPW